MFYKWGIIKTDLNLNLTIKAFAHNFGQKIWTVDW